MTQTLAPKTARQIRAEAAAAKALRETRAEARKDLLERAAQVTLTVLIFMSMLLLVGFTAYATFIGSLVSAQAFGFSGGAEYAVAALPDAFMVIAAARGRRKKINDTVRTIAARCMRGGLALSLIANLIAAFIIKAPNGFWVDYSSDRAVWMQHAVFFAAILWHGVPVLLLWGGTEMLTHTRADAVSFRLIKPRTSKNAGPAKPKAAPASAPATGVAREEVLASV